MTLFLLCSVLLRTVWSWGSEGHKTVAGAAYKLLSAEAKASVRTLIGNMQNVINASTWADQADHTAAYEWSKCMHYIDSADDVCSVDPFSDCPHGCCVVNAIGNYTDRLDDSYPVESRIEAFKFLIHFMGDVHQPLHAGSKSNLGGNAIHVYTDFGSRRLHDLSNLHEVWDTLILVHFESNLKKNGEELLDYISNKISNLSENEIDEINSNCHNLNKTCQLTAAEESSKFACDSAYMHEDGRGAIKSGDTLSVEYYNTRVPIVIDRLVYSAVRLSRVLEDVFMRNGESISLPEIKLE
jgi:hypothetical protein